MKMLKALILFFYVCFVTAFSYGQSDEKIIVKDVFEKYKSALLNDQGEEAVNYVDSKTIEYYGEILEKVKTSDSASVEKLSIMDKVMVLFVRHRTTREQVLNFDNKSLLVYAINSGMVGKNGVSGNTIGDITINNNFAKGQLISNGEKTPLYLHFRKEDNQWKLDLTSLFPMANLAFKELLKDSEVEENEFIFLILESLSRRKPGAEIWLPVN